MEHIKHASFGAHLNKLHDQIEFTVGVHFLNQQNDVGMFHSSQDGHLILNHMFLWGEKLKQKHILVFSFDQNSYHI